MRILAIDVGTGTQDMMIYDTKKELENSIIERITVSVIS
mgnify:CR=1 FL=1